MNVTIHPKALHGAVTAPPSKSHVHRLLIAAALSSGKTAIHCPGENADIDATVRCLRALGAEIQAKDAHWIVTSPVKGGAGDALDCGESGSTLRFLLPLCAALNGSCTLTGSGRLPSRPNGPLLDALRGHGANIQGDFLPMAVNGGLQAGAYALPGNVSSQYFTGLLIALPLLSGDSTLVYTSPLESMPYVDVTLSVLKQFGIQIETLDNGWRIPGNQAYVSPGTVNAEGDWSAAAFWLGANALGSAVTVNGLNPASCQGDKAITKLLAQIGGEIDVTDTPDLMPILSAVAAAISDKTTRIIGAARLRLKESDRLSAMAETIRALGGKVEELPDGLIIHGTRLRGGTVDGHNDHRVVMSAAIAATVCEGPVTILGAEAVNKSYPDFWKDFEALGGCSDG
ncbi:MAG: 3-phosphoshikimate 1-carboxyvinyltransferase [Clostridia bacterium]|nr:3-phosphoshikimate 1-carboxyvinyltransferase [Clostridia bacterium]MBR0409176.1 3-phosphoshikimate 1-carboxyvinyltransferase [Clostridia bacterium]